MCKLTERNACADPESFFSEGSYSGNIFFLVDEGREDQNTTISGPASVCQRNALKWRFAGVPMMAQN